jgi:hypothetical protein
MAGTEDLEALETELQEFARSDREAAGRRGPGGERSPDESAGPN